MGRAEQNLTHAVRGGRWRWVGTILFLGSTLALLGTSPARWTKTASVAGPLTPSAGRGLELTLSSDFEPELDVKGVFSSPFARGDIPCSSPWVPRAYVKCVLPPGATIDSVLIRGDCSGCRGPCVPPAGAFVTADSVEIDVWSDAAARTLPFRIPDHTVSFVATRFEILVQGADFVQLEALVVPRGASAPVFRERQSCRAKAGAPASAGASCILTVHDTDLPTKPLDVDLRLEVEGHGKCGTPGCKAPGTLRVASVTVLK
jgi:hypothetical protein